MSFARVFGGFLKWFHILGQGSSTSSNQLLSPGAKKYFQRVHSNASKHIPVGILLSLNIIVSIIVCWYSSFWDQLTYTLSSGFSKVLNAQNALILAVDTITILIAVGQTVFFMPYFSQLFAHINIIEHLSRKRISWNLLALRRFLIRRMFFVCAGYSLPYMTILFSKPATTTNLILLGGDFILKCLTLISYFQALFYVELFNHMLQSFVNYIETRARTTTTTNVTTIYSRDSDAKSLQIQMYYFKLLHFNLWEFAQTINYLFGWILMIFVLHHFVFIVFIFFHTCVVLLHAQNHKEIFRESSVLCRYLVVSLTFRFFRFGF